MNNSEAKTGDAKPADFKPNDGLKKETTQKNSP